mgnify:CR=1 FL=1
MTSEQPQKGSLPKLTERIVATYSDIGTINHLGHSPLPNTDVVVQVTRDLMEVIYPGYQRRQRLHMGNVPYHVGELIDGLHDKLTQQIAAALQHEHVLNESQQQSAPSESHFERAGQKLAVTLLDSLPALRTLLARDAQAAYDGDPAASGLDEIILCYPGLHAITVHRLAHALFRLDVPFIPRMMSEWSHNQTGVDIHPGATIGPSFFIDHGTGVVIGETCIIGKNVKLYHGVTLGAFSNVGGRRDVGLKRHPTIEDDVTIYPNATILGGETVVGEGSVIGGNVWLTRSVPPFTRVTIETPELQVHQKAPPELGSDI